jgi:D-alanyl-D-alanine carboxypeptidase
VKRIIGLLLVLSATSGLAPVAIAGPTTAQEAAQAGLESTIDRVAADLLARKETAGFAIGIAEKGKIRLVKGYGFADLEERVAVTDRTVFRIGSVTKEFTSAAILLLAEQGKLSLDDPLSKYFPDFPRGGEITLRNLLNHTSGIHNYTSIDGFLQNESTRALRSDEVVRYIATAKPLYDFDPGTGWNYSNSGFMLLGLVVEKASGQPLAQYLKASIFDPLGLNDTRLDNLAEIVPGRARGYDKAPGSPLGFANAGFISMEVAAGAGAIRSTAGDLLKWHAALLGGKLLKPASLALMTAPAKLKDGRLASAARPTRPGAAPSDYGFGIMIGQQKGRRTIGHGGAINGFNASLNTYPDQQVTIVVLSNTTGGAGAVANAMTDAVFGPPPAKADAPAPAAKPQ